MKTWICITLYSSTHHNWRVLNGNNAGHDIDNPLWIDDDVVPEEFIVKVLQRSLVMEELYSSFHLRQTH